MHPDKRVADACAFATVSGSLLRMAHTEKDGRDWKKSSRSGKLGNSIHVAHLDVDSVLIKCDKDPGKVLYATGAEFAAFREAIKAGEFDNYGAWTEPASHA